MSASSVYARLADATVFIHLAWVLFMVAGVGASVAGLWWQRILGLRFLRWLHLGGLIFSASLGIIKRPCPLTTLEYWLRRQSGSAPVAPESFAVRLANRLIFPDMNQQLLSVMTIAAALVVIAIFAWKPPWRYGARQT